ncbi:hypothetical protein CCACVL1_08484 [Corchorus capsularis]|uniref:Uncharacterized protein n=1 Tax=Corchorus capsularis TaxID=210143 RepID=A0A1R3J0C4_COCAP|nr:hypothetical protein CCACVL1_08484 [Corchorus capsularis]
MATSAKVEFNRIVSHVTACNVRHVA